MEKKKQKKNILLVVIVLVVLAAAVLILAAVNRPDQLPESGVVSIVSGGQQLREYTMNDIEAMDYVEVEKEIVSSSYANDEGLFRGVALHALLESAGADLSAAAQAIVRSEDGFVAVFPMDEVTDGDSILLVYSKNGESLGTKEDGGSGPFRILAVEDDFGNRCAKYVSEIEVK